MHKVSISVPLAMSKEGAWEKLFNLSLPHRYVPLATCTKITTKQCWGIGTSRLVYFCGFIPLRETVSQWREGDGFCIDLALKNRSMPFCVISFDYNLSGDAAGAMITNTLKYKFHHDGLDRTIGIIIHPVIKAIVLMITNKMKRFYEARS